MSKNACCRFLLFLREESFFETDAEQCDDEQPNDVDHHELPPRCTSGNKVDVCEDAYGKHDERGKDYKDVPNSSNHSYLSIKRMITS